MPRLIVLAEPRSASTYFMKQFERSPLLYLCTRNHHELITPQRRDTTRKYLRMSPVDDSDSWSRDIHYVAEFVRKRRNSAFKVIAHAHGKPFVNFLTKLPDTKFVTLRRQDEASTIASIISRQTISRQRPNEQVWLEPSRSSTIKFRDAIGLMNNTTPCRYLDITYWGVINKTKHVFDSFPNAHVLTTEDFHAGFQHELADQFQMTFDFSDYIKPSHYSEIFSDWKFYEDTMRQVLGNVPGLG